jgi:hypothetical protein
LRQFRKGDPLILLVEPERLQAETAIYRTVFANFQAASTGTAEVVDHFARLLEYTRKHGNRVEIRFRRKHADSVEAIEQLVKKSVYYIGPPALPAQYFDAAHCAPEEAKVVAALVDRFASVIPRDVLDFELGAPFTADESDVPKVDLPTLLISHRIDMSGPLTSNKPRGAFVGVSFTFKAVLLVPNEKAPPIFSQSIWVPPRLKLIDEEHKSLKEMYESMAGEAFSRFESKYLAYFFRAKPN